MKRKIKLLDGEIESFWIKSERNPCGCGSNVFHIVDDGLHIIGVCNSCSLDIYEYKEREEFNEWKYED